MAKPKSVATAGIQLLYSVYGTPAATLLAGIRKWSGLPEIKFDKFETTEVDGMRSDGTTPKRAKTFEPGRYDPGEVMMTLSFDPTNVALVYTLKGMWMTWAVKIRDGSKFPFDGWISGIKPVPNDTENILFEVTIQTDDEEEVGFVPAS